MALDVDLDKKLQDALNYLGGRTTVDLNRGTEAAAGSVPGAGGVGSAAAATPNTFVPTGGGGGEVPTLASLMASGQWPFPDTGGGPGGSTGGTGGPSADAPGAGSITGANPSLMGAFGSFPGMNFGLPTGMGMGMGIAGQLAGMGLQGAFPTVDQFGNPVSFVSPQPFGPLTPNILSALLGQFMYTDPLTGIQTPAQSMAPQQGAAQNAMGISGFGMGGFNSLGTLAGLGNQSFTGNPGIFGDPFSPTPEIEVPSAPPPPPPPPPPADPEGEGTGPGPGGPGVGVGEGTGGGTGGPGAAGGGGDYDRGGMIPGRKGERKMIRALAGEMVMNPQASQSARKLLEALNARYVTVAPSGKRKRVRA